MTNLLELAERCESATGPNGYRAKSSNALNGKRIICKAHPETIRLIISRAPVEKDTRTGRVGGTTHTTDVTSPRVHSVIISRTVRALRSRAGEGV